jgi:hypothetical protein
MKLSNPGAFNIDLAQRTLDYVNRFPEKHRQHSVMNRCGSVGCIAGWAAELSGKYKSLAELGVHADKYVSRSVIARAELGLTEAEFDEFFGEGDEKKAKKILAKYIEQAMVAQVRKSDLVPVEAVD